MKRPPWSCGGCSTRWTSLVQCHCGRCHQHFSTVGVFDHAHRGGVCRDPQSVTRRNGDPVFVLAQTVDGPVWRRFNKQDREFAA